MGLSVGHETWPPIGWHHAFVIGWWLWLPNAPLHYGFTWQWEFSSFFRPRWQSLCTALMAGRCLGLCKGTVKESMAIGLGFFTVSSSYKHIGISWTLFSFHLRVFFVCQMFVEKIIECTVFTIIFSGVLGTWVKCIHGYTVQVQSCC